MKKILFISIFFLSGYNMFAQNLNDSINWLSLDSVSAKFAKVQKPVFIYFYADNCDSCRVQEQTTFSNPEVANYINILFYPVKLNAYTQDTLTFFDGHKYINSPKTGKMHDLAYTVTGRNDTLPAIVIFSRRAKGQSFIGYMNRDEIFRPLIYYAEDIDQWTDYPIWEREHKKAYPPGKEQIMTRLNVKWKTLSEANELNKTHPKKMLLHFYNYYKISSTVMRTQSFNNQVNAEILNRKFYPVNINVFTQDTLEFKGYKYINENKPYKYHQLPIAALQSKMIFPAFIITDENGQVLDRIQKYMPPEELEHLLTFYGDDIYKKMSWKAYLKSLKKKHLHR